MGGSALEWELVIALFMPPPTCNRSETHAVTDRALSAKLSEEARGVQDPVLAPSRGGQAPRGGCGAHVPW